MQNLVAFLGELHAKGVILYLHQQVSIPTRQPTRRCFRWLGVFAEFERAMIVERVKAGLSQARTRESGSGVSP